MKKKIYFASDQHFGIPDHKRSLEREKKFVSWLEEIKKDASELFLLGDLFDYWFEYKHVIPKGYVRLLGKLADLSDRGIPIHFFVGNHDMWMRDYLQKELGIEVYFERKEFKRGGKLFLIGHGDGLGPKDKAYKRMKKLFRNPIAIWLMRWLHPDLGIPIGVYFSTKNKMISGQEGLQSFGKDEWLVSYCYKKLEQKKIDFFLFGHRHLPIDFRLNETSRYINIGDWITNFTYAVFDGNSLELKKYCP